MKDVHSHLAGGWNRSDRDLSNIDWSGKLKSIRMPMTDKFCVRWVKVRLALLNFDTFPTYSMHMKFCIFLSSLQKS